MQRDLWRLWSWFYTLQLLLAVCFVLMLYLYTVAATYELSLSALVATLVVQRELRRLEQTLRNLLNRQPTGGPSGGGVRVRRNRRTLFLIHRRSATFW
ncbi:hypothetical protein KC722_00395 [Candidatus Kaiserbacteria bacterium]|nr:hypothetical protein [Candidatus Kaiserbacteria bacterium]